MAHRLVVHCKRLPYDVYVGRGKDPFTGLRGAFGNRFGYKGSTSAEVVSASREDCILDYYEWLMGEEAVLEAVLRLKGKRLGCWCAPLLCHGDVIAMVANREIEELSGYIDRLRIVCGR